MSEKDEGRKPVSVIILGMAGTGKTTLMQRINAHVHTHQIPSYIINLDPAVTHMPYEPNIDIRDTVKYKEVMKEYHLGPNGAIMTSLNLFATRFDQVMQFVEKRREAKYVFLDTPGQIEVFTWSASGTIITETLGSAMPTVVVYVVDTPRSANPSTFMSNMLYACSIMYKSKLPFIVVFNKTDVLPHDFAVEWMTDFEAFRDAIDAESGNVATDLIRSMSLVMDEFYANLRTVGVSAVTGEGMDEFFAAVDDAAEEYHREYEPELKRRKEEQEQKEARAKEDTLVRLKRDLEEDGGMRVVMDGDSSHGDDDLRVGDDDSRDSDDESDGYEVPGERETAEQRASFERYLRSTQLE